MAAPGIRIGIDLGGTKIALIAFDEAGRVLLERRVATPAGDYDRTLAAIVSLVSGAEAQLGRRGTVGIGTPGSPSRRTGLMRNCNSTVLNGKALEKDLTSRLGRDVRVANDADCFALSESRDGAAHGAAVVFGAILGTGVGGGVIVDGRRLGERNGIAGEWGHVPLPWPRDDERPGPPCYCGKFGCNETWLSGPGLTAEHARCTGSRAPAQQIAADASNGEPAAVATLERYADRLARGLATVVDLIDPDVIVLGGGLSNIAALYRLVPPLLERYAFCDALDTKFVRARFGDASGVRGAARLWPEAG